MSKVENKEHNAKDLEEVNLGIDEMPKKVYIGKNLAPKIRQGLIDLLRMYRHVFAWSYDELNSYREDFFGMRFL